MQCFTYILQLYLEFYLSNILEIIYSKFLQEVYSNLAAF